MKKINYLLFTLMLSLMTFIPKIYAITDLDKNVQTIDTSVHIFSSQEIYLFCGLIVLFIITFLVILTALNAKAKIQEINNKN